MITEKLSMPSPRSLKIGCLVFLQVRAALGYGCLRLRCARAAKTPRKMFKQRKDASHMRYKYQERSFLSKPLWACFFLTITGLYASLYYGDLVQIKMKQSENQLTLDLLFAGTLRKVLDKDILFGSIVLQHEFLLFFFFFFLLVLQNLNFM